MTGSRLLVHRPISTPFAKGLPNGWRPSRSAGRGRYLAWWVDDQPGAVKARRGYGQAAIDQGAKIVVRGGPLFKQGPLAKGAFYRPALLEITDHSMPIAQDEVFGPVLRMMQAFDTEAEAIELANNSAYGLAASVWSTNIDRPLRIARKIDAGTVWITTGGRLQARLKEGGYKQTASDG